MAKKLGGDFSLGDDFQTVPESKCVPMPHTYLNCATLTAQHKGLLLKSSIQPDNSECTETEKREIARE